SVTSSKLLRTPHSLKPGPFRSISRTRAAKKPGSVPQKRRASSTRVMAGKAHNVLGMVLPRGKQQKAPRNGGPLFAPPRRMVLPRGKRQKAQRRYFVACAMLLLLLSIAGSLFSLVEYQTYNAQY